MTNASDVFSDMCVYTVLVTARDQIKAWKDWDPKTGHRRLGWLASGTCHGDIASRCGDRMLQKARKAGLAQYSNGKWEKIAGAS
jgi:hypothetical protein